MFLMQWSNKFQKCTNKRNQLTIRLQAPVISSRFWLKEDDKNKTKSFTTKMTYRALDIGTSESPVSRTRPKRTSPWMSPWLRHRARRRIWPVPSPKTARRRRRTPPPNRNHRPEGHMWYSGVSYSRSSAGIFCLSGLYIWRI